VTRKGRTDFDDLLALDADVGAKHLLRGDHRAAADHEIEGHRGIFL
jgi:hypothetical protein